MAVNGGHAGTKKGPNWGHVKLQTVCVNGLLELYLHASCLIEKQRGRTVCTTPPKSVHINPPFRKHCAHETTIEELFSEGLREIVALCFLCVFEACFQESICAMAILPLRQNISEEVISGWIARNLHNLCAKEFSRH